MHCCLLFVALFVLRPLFSLRPAACRDRGTEGRVLRPGRLRGLVFSGVPGDPPRVPTGAAVAEACGQRGQRQGQVQAQAQAEDCGHPSAAALCPSSPLLELGPHQGARPGDAVIAVVQAHQRRPVTAAPRLRLPARDVLPEESHHPHHPHAAPQPARGHRCPPAQEEPLLDLRLAQQLARHRLQPAQRQQQQWGQRGPREPPAPARLQVPLHGHRADPEEARATVQLPGRAGSGGGVAHTLPHADSALYLGEGAQDSLLSNSS